MKAKTARTFDDDPLAGGLLQLLQLEDTAGMSRKCIEAEVAAALNRLVNAGIVRCETISGREKWFAAWSCHNEYMLKASVA